MMVGCRSLLTSPVHHLDDLIQDDEGGLQTGELNQGFHSTRIRLSTSLNLLATFTQTSETEVVVSLGLVALESGQEDTRDVFLLGSQAEAGLASRLLNLVSDVTTNRI